MFFTPAGDRPLGRDEPWVAAGVRPHRPMPRPVSRPHLLPRHRRLRRSPIRPEQLWGVRRDLRERTRSRRVPERRLRACELPRRCDVLRCRRRLPRPFLRSRTLWGVSAACASGVCSGGVCAAGGSCAEGQTDCGGVCVDTCCNNQHCGACGNVCPAGETCFEGICGCPSGLCCAEGETICNGTCVATCCDNNNCGACGNVKAV